VFRAKSPVSDREQAWIEKSLRWFVDEFGDAGLRGAVVVPSREFFPAGHSGAEEDVRALVARVCARMDVDVDRVELEFYSEGHDPELLRKLPSFEASSSRTAGHYRRRGDKMILAIEGPDEHNPTALVAVIAHELGHERLLGEGRIDPSREDGEPLTDLLTVFLGLGIFTANAAFDFDQHAGGWQMQRLGYLTEQMYGYALAYYAYLRGETDPAWAEHLDTNPRAYMKKSLKYLSHREELQRPS
jgi:hypothetical protein